MRSVVTLTLAKGEKKYQWSQPVKPPLFWRPCRCWPSSTPVVEFINMEAPLINKTLWYLTLTHFVYDNHYWIPFYSL